MTIYTTLAKLAKQNDVSRMTANNRLKSGKVVAVFSDSGKKKGYIIALDALKFIIHKLNPGT